MSRPKTVTRTIKTMTVTVLALDTCTAEPHNVDYPVTKSFRNDADLLNYLRKTYETETFKIAAVVAKAETHNKYTVTEEAFINLANQQAAENAN